MMWLVLGQLFLLVLLGIRVWLHERYVHTGFCLHADCLQANAAVLGEFDLRIRALEGKRP